MMDRKKKKGSCWGWFVLLIVLGGIAFSIFVLFRNSKPGSVFAAAFSVSKKYSNALGVAMQFFDVQKCTFSSLITRSLQSQVLLNFFKIRTPVACTDCLRAIGAGLKTI